ncbi:MAG TPA: RdgB/HAM1 family non-canonical purine NTP pyrophosphatase [Dehalococcoidia bacterium]|nr:RdgB/HAM1 family non-canonical purine NTP pyrophosphatase [Dehalococcoidia bacterium]
MPKLVIATNNPGKVRELRDLLAGCGWDVVGPRDLGLELDPAETGATYAENARLKAQAFADASGFAALADDSGLEVDALGGEPGALHHEHGWDGRNNEERIRILLDALKDVPSDRRTGRYRAVVTVVLPDGSSLEEEGAIEGVIVDTPAGHEGFGYDPVFFLPSRGRTMAQLSPEEKNRISHRAVAALKLYDRLKQLAPRYE